MAPSHEAPIIAAAGEYHLHAPEEYGVEELRRTLTSYDEMFEELDRPGRPVARRRAGARAGHLPRLRRRPAARRRDRPRDRSRLLHRPAPREVGCRARGDPAGPGGGRRRDGACARAARGGRAGRRRGARDQRGAADERGAPRRDRRCLRRERRFRGRLRRLARPADGDRPPSRRGADPRRRAGDRGHLAAGQQVGLLHGHDPDVRRRRARPPRSSNGTASASSGSSSRSGSFGRA